MIHFEFTVLIRRSVHMSVLLYVHQKRDNFSSPFTYLHSRVAPPPLTNFVFILCFLTAFIVTSRPQLFSRERGGALKKPIPILLLVKGAPLHALYLISSIGYKLSITFN